MNNICAVICSRQDYGNLDINRINNALRSAISLGVDTFYIGLDSQAEYNIVRAIQQLQQTMANITVIVVGHICQTSAYS